MIRVLIVDDSVLFRKTLKEILASGYGIIADDAADGKEALAKAKTGHPDVVFVDVKLHEENGLHLTKHLKDADPRTMVVVISSLDSKEYQEAAYASGADRFISKNTGTLKELEAIMSACRP
jgi:DNA-binding NarL/FixJ family response regulator